MAIVVWPKAGVAAAEVVSGYCQRSLWTPLSTADAGHSLLSFLAQALSSQKVLSYVVEIGAAIAIESDIHDQR